ncbi:hypothetical protein C8J56DRAFT_755910, partial [Mycena floridula]
IATTLVTSKMAENVSRQNGPVTVQKQIALEQGIIVPWDTCDTIMHQNGPTGAEVRFPGKKSKKVHGHLTGIGLLQEIYADGHEKLDWRALRTGTVSLNVYGM